MALDVEPDSLAIDCRDSPQLQSFLLHDARPTGTKLGDGSYGTVEELDVVGLLCAGKKLHGIFLDKLRSHPTELQILLERFVRECTLLSDLRHPHIVQFLGICFLKGSSLPVLVMEYLPHDLDKVLQGTKDLPMSIKHPILCDIARGLAFLHGREPPVIHRDLTAKNILLNSALVAKIADLGVARILDLHPGQMEATMSQIPGTHCYMPPEALEKNPKYNSTIDVFSFGHLALYVAVQEFPHLSAATRPDPKNPGKVIGLTEVERRSQQMEQISTKLGKNHPLEKLIAKCLHNESRERPSARQVLSELVGMKLQLEDTYGRMSKLELIQALREKENGGLAPQGPQGELAKPQDTLQAKEEQPEAVQSEARSKVQELEERLQAKDDQIAAAQAEAQSKVQELEDKLKAKEQMVADQAKRWSAAQDLEAKLLTLEGEVEELKKQRPLEFEAVALYDYPSTDRKELPLHKGQCVFVFDYNGDWWQARDTNGREGYVPSNFVRKLGVDKEYKVLPALSKALVEDTLKSEGKEGGYLLWMTHDTDAVCTLSLYDDGKVVHYHVKQTENKHYYIITEDHQFTTIRDLIAHHKRGKGVLVAKLGSIPEKLTPAKKLPASSSLPAPSSPLYSVEINDADLEIGEEIKTGRFARILSGRWNDKTGDGSIRKTHSPFFKRLRDPKPSPKTRDVAIKVVRRGVTNEDDLIEEAKVMMQLKSENIVQLYGVRLRKKPLLLIMEMMESSLLQYLRNSKELVEKIETIGDIASQVRSGMAYLESIHCIHRALAAHNCLVGKLNLVKVADFHMAKFSDSGEYVAPEDSEIHIKWAAPEVITHGRFSSKSDVWAFGVLLMEVWTTGRIPYHGMTNYQVKDMVVKGYRMPQPKKRPDGLYSIIKWCWEASPGVRPTFELLESSVNSLVQKDEYTCYATGDDIDNL